MEIRRQEYFDHGYHKQQEPYTCRSCEADLCPSHSNLHHLSPHYINKKLNLIQNNNVLINKNPLLVKRTSLSQESLSLIQEHQPMYQHQQEPMNPVIKNSRNLVRLNKMRLCKSEDSLTELSRDLKDFRADPENFHKRARNEQILDYSSSDDDYLTDNNGRNQNFDTLSSQSSFSITTEANGDFEFFQTEDSRPREKFFNGRLSGQSFKIEPSIEDIKFIRSTSKRSLENIQTVIEDVELFNNKLQRSNSYTTLEDRRKGRNNKKLLRSNSKLSDCTHNIRQKIKSVEYLPNSNASTVFIEDVFYFNYPSQRKGGEIRNYIGSVPDLKKVFISEYI